MALLTHLEAVGFPYSPRVVGQDEGGDLLSFIPGSSGAAGWAPAAGERGLVAAAHLLRAYHDAVRQWRPDVDPVWFDGSTGTGAEGELVCHGDFHPANLVWNDIVPDGLLDFEYARVGDPIEDVAYACEYFVPFRDDAECLRWLAYAEPPDRRRRLVLFAEAYGLDSAEGLVDRVIARQQDTRDLVERLGRQGFSRQQDLVAAGFLDELDARIRWSHQHRALLE